MTELSISKRVRHMAPSATLAMAAAARELADEGIDIATLSAGEPDFATPQAICEIAKASIDQDKTHYAPVRGTKAMISALQEKFLRDQKVAYAPDEVMCTVGAKAALMMALTTVVEEGDEVILCAPFWVSYREQVNLLGGIPVIIQCKQENNFMPTGDQIARAISAKTKAIIINSPNNPSGGVISKEQLLELATVVKNTAIWIISDEIYEKLLFNNSVHFSPAALSADMRTRSIVISGASKGYAMTGWRVGFVGAPKKIISAMGNLQGQETTCLPEFIQDAAVYALRENNAMKAQIEHMRRAYDDRRMLFLRLFAPLSHIKIFQPQGAFYVWADFSYYVHKTIAQKIIESDMDLAIRMLKEAHVACVPGSPFGVSGFLRFSIASSAVEIEKAFVRIARWLES